jgi:hypothetical protein
MKIIAYSIFTVVIIIFLPLILMAISDFTGIGKKEDGYKIYKVSSSLKEGQDFIDKNKIKCVGEGVDMIAFMDIGRKKTFFAYDVDYNNYYFVEKINYYEVPDELVKKYKLTPQFTWLEKHGETIYNWIAWILLGGALLIWLALRKWK